jgi:hypothetical protein
VFGVHDYGFDALYFLIFLLDIYLKF